MDPFYVLTLRKVQIFGFRISGGNQLYFLMDESETLGQDGKNTHGPIAVLSMIDCALESRCQPSQSFTIHADNCPGRKEMNVVSSIYLLSSLLFQLTCISMVRCKYNKAALLYLTTWNIYIIYGYFTHFFSGKTKALTSFDTSCGGRDTIEYLMQIQSMMDNGFLFRTY